MIREARYCSKIFGFLVWPLMFSLMLLFLLNTEECFKKKKKAAGNQGRIENRGWKVGKSSWGLGMFGIHL